MEQIPNVRVGATKTHTDFLLRDASDGQPNPEPADAYRQPTRGTCTRWCSPPCSQQVPPAVSGPARRSRERLDVCSTYQRARCERWQGVIWPGNWSCSHRSARRFGGSERLSTTTCRIGARDCRGRRTGLSATRSTRPACAWPVLREITSNRVSGFLWLDKCLGRFASVFAHSRPDRAWDSSSGR
jgi:hypothetical protein